VLRKEVLRLLGATGVRYAPGTVGKALAESTRAGELVNPRDKRGYRLQDWTSQAATPSLF
jgi:hypothetical protein